MANSRRSEPARLFDGFTAFFACDERPEFALNGGKVDRTYSGRSDFHFGESAAHLNVQKCLKNNNIVLHPRYISECMERGYLCNAGEFIVSSLPPVPELPYITARVHAKVAAGELRLAESSHQKDSASGGGERRRKKNGSSLRLRKDGEAPTTVTRATETEKQERAEGGKRKSRPPAVVKREKVKEEERREVRETPVRVQKSRVSVGAVSIRRARMQAHTRKAVASSSRLSQEERRKKAAKKAAFLRSVVMR